MPLRKTELFLEQPQEVPHMWGMMDEAPFENLLEQKDLVLEDTGLEFKKVKSLREEQEIKIAQFLPPIYIKFE